MEFKPAIDYGYDWEKARRIAKAAVSDINPWGWTGARSIENDTRLVETESSVYPTFGFMYSIVLPLTLVMAQSDPAYAKDVAITMVILKTITSLWTRYKSGDFVEDFKSLGKILDRL